MKIVLLICIIIAVLGLLFFYFNQPKTSLKKLAVKAKKTKTAISNKPSNSTLKNRKINKINRKTSENPANNQFRCVIIVPGLIACKLAQSMRDKAVLMNEAPVLPLSGCDMGKCACKYTRHLDRRMNNRRDAVNVARQITGNIDNKRERLDRRQVSKDSVKKLD